MENIHQGHREKMRQRFLKSGLESFADHEALELLLYYAIPRQDTNPIAHRLLERYGSLSAVLSAPAEDLKKVEGIGESAAVLLKVAGQIGRKARLSDAAQSRAMTDVETVGAYLLERYAGETHEVVYQLCLDRKGKLLACKRLNDGGASSASLDIRKVVENAILTSASTVILAHNHPSGIALPSDDDCAATTQAVQALQTIGVVLADHIIVADDDFVSMGYDRMSRNCYDRNMVQAFRDQVKQSFVPFVSKLHARRAQRLEELAAQLTDDGLSVLTLPLDLCDTMSFTAYHEHLVEEQPEISLLINNAGCGYLGKIGEVDTVSQTRMIDLNLRALTAITNLSVPYMEAGSRILNVSSIAAFCPTPRMTVYSATKAYVSAYTIGAAEELKAKGITVTAVCPGPMATEFLETGHIHNSPAFELLPYCDQVRVAGGALRAAKAGQTIYTPRLFYKFYRLLAKLTPAKLMVKLTKT